MLARVAATLRDRHNVRLGFAGAHTGGDEHQIVLDENCSVSQPYLDGVAFTVTNCLCSYK